MFKTIAITAALLAAAATSASAVTIDTIDASNGGAGTYFVPSLGLETTGPYYRGQGDGWGWSHNGIASGFTSASLNISAYDVDETPCSRSVCEVDNIEAYDALSDTWILLGALTGQDDMFSFTDFDLLSYAGGDLADDIVNGLQVRMEISVLDSFWFVSLAKSVITTDGADPGNPDPGVVPLPAGGWLMITGLAGLAAMRRRRKSS